MGGRGDAVADTGSEQAGVVLVYRSLISVYWSKTRCTKKMPNEAEAVAVIVATVVVAAAAVERVGAGEGATIAKVAACLWPTLTLR